MEQRFQLSQLRDLMALIEHGGFRAAARKLDVSQAGLTRSVAKLEDALGILIVDRTVTGIALTSDGRAFLPYAATILAEADRAENWLEHRRSSRTTTVKVGMSVEPALRFLPKILLDFGRAAPSVTTHLTQSAGSELLQALRENRIDLAVMRLPRDSDVLDMTIDMLYTTEAVIVARTGHPNANANRLEELAHLSWVVVGDPRHAAEEDDSIQELFLQQSLLPPRSLVVSDYVLGALSLLVDSDCISRLPRAILLQPIAKQSVVEIPITERAKSFHVGLVRKTGRWLSPEAKLLASIIFSFARTTAARSADHTG